MDYINVRENSDSPILSIKIKQQDLFSDSKNVSDLIACLRLQLHGAIYRPDSFVLMQRYCANLKAVIYELPSLKRIVADKSRV